MECLRSLPETPEIKELAALLYNPPFFDPLLNGTDALHNETRTPTFLQQLAWRAGRADWPRRWEQSGELLVDPS